MVVLERHPRAGACRPTWHGDPPARRLSPGGGNWPTGTRCRSASNRNPAMLVDTHRRLRGNWAQTAGQTPDGLRHQHSTSDNCRCVEQQSIPDCHPPGPRPGWSTSRFDDMRAGGTHEQPGVRCRRDRLPTGARGAARDRLTRNLVGGRNCRGHGHAAPDVAARSLAFPAALPTKGRPMIDRPLAGPRWPRRPARLVAAGWPGPSRAFTERPSHIRTAFPAVGRHWAGRRAAPRRRHGTFPRLEPSTDGARRP